MFKEDELELLSAFLDHELNSDELNRVNKLLATSADARLELERLRKTKGFLAGAPALAAPPDLLDELAAMVHQKPAAKPPLALRRYWVYGGSLATAAGFVLWLAAGALRRPAVIPVESLLAAHARFESSTALDLGETASADYAAFIGDKSSAPGHGQ